jgi:hypothetical protein
VPADILPFGPDDPRALAWLWEHWGTTEALRHVAEDTEPGAADADRDGEFGVFRLRFWSADWTPWHALTETGQRWPGLRFDIRPTYDPP